MREAATLSALALAGVAMTPRAIESMIAPRLIYRMECFDADGALKWTEEFENLVTTVGRTDIVDKYLKGSAYTAGWFCLLAGSGTKAAGDTLASHAGWAEISAYSGNRPAITWGTTSSGSNTATAVAFSMNANYTVAGAGICTVATTNSGTLYSVGDFAVARGGGSGDTINVTMTISVT